jgi:hypothetical protein
MLLQGGYSIAVQKTSFDPHFLPQGTRIHLQLAASRSQKHRK